MTEPTAVELDLADPADVLAPHDLYREYEWWDGRSRRTGANGRQQRRHRPP